MKLSIVYQKSIGKPEVSWLVLFLLRQWRICAIGIRLVWPFLLLSLLYSFVKSWLLAPCSVKFPFPATNLKMLVLILMVIHWRAQRWRCMVRVYEKLTRSCLVLCQLLLWFLLKLLLYALSAGEFQLLIQVLNRTLTLCKISILWIWMIIYK